MLVIALSSPLLIGIYNNTELIKSFQSIEKTDKALPEIFDKILKNYKVNQIFFTNGPGSFMSIKMSYIFLKTLAIVHKIPIFAKDGFSFNHNKPIKSVGKSYFIKKNDTISIEKHNDPQEFAFFLPQNLDKSIFSENIEPLYILPPI